MPQPGPNETVLWKNVDPTFQAGAPRSVDELPWNEVAAQPGEKAYIYVVMEDGDLRLGSFAEGVKHIDLSGGDPVRAAGLATFSDGQLVSVDNQSGHYQPFGATAETEAMAAFGREFGGLANGAQYTPVPYARDAGANWYTVPTLGR